VRDLTLHSLKTQVDVAFDQDDSIEAGAMQLRAEYSRYLCVRASGLIETSVRRIFSEHARRASSPAVGRYAAWHVGRLQNINCDKLLKLVETFDPTWKAAVEAYLSEERATALNSIVANRNAIAHGNPSGVTYGTVKPWYEHAVDVLEFLEDTYLPVAT
jgi:hypothetical protein